MNQSKQKSEWRNLKLSEVIKVKSGDSLSKSKMEYGEIPVFGGNGISGYHSAFNSDESKLVIGRVGEYCGAVHKAPQYSWITDNALYVSEKKVAVNDEYLYFLLCHLDLNQYANRNAQPLVSGKTLEQVNCLLPVCNIEQQKIAEVLSTVGQKIDLIDKQIAETQKLKTGLMQKLFSEGVGVQDEEGNWQPHTEFQESPLGLVPKSWEVSKLGDYALKIGSGVTPKGGSKAYVEKGIPLLRSQNVLFGKFKLDDVAFITDDQHEKMKGSKLQARDVLLNITGASIGRCAVLPSNFKEGNVNQHVCIIRTKDDLEPEFCGIFLNSYLGQKQIWSLQAGGNREGLNFQQIRSFHIPIISQDEQKAIFDICSTVDEKLALLEKQKAETQQLKKGLMQKLLTGEWRVPLDTH
ncbi:restriction endonuclease subunit S [Vibrio splendidus]|uniref:restriction endonuclease subunit S n=1 Tax=Vibrio splendidus TaxID=29497 RepID=UPI000C832B91|nr:restriction endonuclease subunit S [Vibrio splendidus]